MTGRYFVQLALWGEDLLIEEDLRDDPDFDMDEFNSLAARYPEYS